jgi:hypothetical protein
MKKIIMLFSIITLFSCRNDENANNDQTEVTMIGKWSFQKVDVVKSSNGQTQTTENSDCNKKTIQEFTTTKNISTFYGLVNNVCQLTGEVNSQNYTFDKTNMKFWYENEQNYYYITKLNLTELVFEDRTQDIDGDNKTDIIRRYFTKMK